MIDFVQLDISIKKISDILQNIGEKIDYRIIINNTRKNSQKRDDTSTGSNKYYKQVRSWHIEKLKMLYVVYNGQ